MENKETNVKSVSCPSCGSHDINLTWVDSMFGECQVGECYECEHEWNECAR